MAYEHVYTNAQTGEVTVVPYTQEEIDAIPPPTLAQYAEVTQLHIDLIAQDRGYRDGFAIAGYKDSTIPAWSAEAATFIAWRDAVWVYAYAQLDAVQNGQRSAPTLDDFLLELPVINWGS